MTQPFRIGDKVRHYRYGFAKVVDIRPAMRGQAWDKITIQRGRIRTEVDSCDVFKVRA
jgi:hypothetical protein